ncbi:MAG TPA: FAD-binding oxidoreductase [Gemmatimonadales bacterium]|nr:FAD-binding oxidoreductase [Gemmatimonadales bacterium]
MPPIRGASPFGEGRGESGRIVPAARPIPAGEEESLDVWGFRGAGFELLPNGSVILHGARYAGSGVELPDLLPWVQRTLEVEIQPGDIHPSAYPPAIPGPHQNPGFLREIEELLPPGAVSSDPELRLRHGHGHTLEEMYAIKYGRIDRVPDLIVYPETEPQVATLVAAAARHDVCLVPYGGGTNVTDALRCPPDEDRTIVSVDLARLNRVLWIDPVNLMARIEAGAVGRHLQTQLAEYGFTLGHEPDSVEFSTLGGWIATFASGMKKNRYGNIEDLVLDVQGVTPLGELAHAAPFPRESAGLDLRRWLFGSEGSLGIITSAVVKIFPLPPVQRYDAVLFPDFEAGVAFLYDLTREAVPPASVRLVDNLQFQLSQTLKPRAVGARALKRKLEKLLVTRLRGFDPNRMVACTLVYEGSPEEVHAQERAVRRLVRRHAGMRAGAENGRRGYQLTFGIAYLRDFVMRHWVLGESFETSVPWSRILPLCTNVKQRLHAECARRGVPGRPFVTARVTQVYQTGVCVYFYFGFYHKGIPEPVETFAELERAARDEILNSGGSLSHHHGVGKLRRGFLPRVFSSAALEWSGEIKRAVDPGNIFGIGNLVSGSTPAGRPAE